MEVGKLYKRRNNEFSWCDNTYYQPRIKDYQPRIKEGLLEIDIAIFSGHVDKKPPVLHTLLIVEQMKNGFKVLSGKQLYFLPKFLTLEFARDWEEAKDGL